MKKYELTNDTILVEGKTLYRIRALKDFRCVKKGSLGGYIEKEENLSHEGDAWVGGDARVNGTAWVSGDARVNGTAWVSGDAWVGGNAQVNGTAWVEGSKDYLCVGRIGSRSDFTTFFRSKKGEIEVTCGCFLGTLAEFRAKVKETHGDNQHARMYNLAADMAELQILGDDEE